LLNFFDKHLKKLEIPWRDRKISASGQRKIEPLPGFASSLRASLPTATAAISTRSARSAGTVIGRRQSFLFERHAT